MGDGAARRGTALRRCPVQSRAASYPIITKVIPSFQCILTRADHELFYSGENTAGIVQPQSLTCPFCGRLGYTETTLADHVSSAHSDSSHDSQEVICPICASTPGGDPNHLLTWSDFSTHINLEHRSTGQRDLISFLDEPSRSGAGVRRVPHSRGGIHSIKNQPVKIRLGWRKSKNSQMAQNANKI